jgi:hypothetical protein
MSATNGSRSALNLPVIPIDPPPALSPSAPASRPGPSQAGRRVGQLVGATAAGVVFASVLPPDAWLVVTILAGGVGLVLAGGVAGRLVAALGAWGGRD